MRVLRRIILTISFINILPFFVFGQVDTAEVYRNARHVPRFQAKSVEKLSDALAKNCSNDEEVVLSYAYWICKNLKLDYAEYEKRQAETKSIKKILRSRKALADGYTKLFVELCSSQKIPAIYVSGYTKDYDYVAGDTLYRAEYAWALVKLGDEWNIMDLTAASSKVTSVVSPVSKVLWTLFKVPYSSHLVAVKDYNPAFLYVDPKTFAKQHLPAVDVFQLMRYPLPMSYYMAGDSAINVYFENYPEVQKNSEELDVFETKGFYDRNLYFADKSLETNAFTQYTKALYYYYAVKMFFNATYIEEKGKVFASLEESQKALRYAQVSDSLFSIATQNNVQEQMAKQVRSEKWKKNLVESNKLLASQLSTQGKMNSQQIRELGKINNQNKKIQDYINKYRGKYVLRDIVDLSKPMIQNKELKEEGMEKINRSMELSENCASMIHDYDSLMQPLMKNKVDSVYRMQQSVSNLCNQELASLSRYLDKKGSNLSLVYYSDKYVFKKGYFEVFAKVGEMNDTYTDPTIEFLSERIPLIYDVIQRYVKETIESLRLLKEAKVVLANDYGEDDMYEKIALAFNKQLGVFEKQIADVTDFCTKMSACLDDDVVVYKDISKMLQNDNTMESYRHKEYMNYRKSLKQAENDKIKYYQETLRNYQKLIAKAVNGK
ncbi:MAG: hypothetical protein MJ198_03430 [Bacteroidales bacterium]|nr:hypothetical protein [Bacteroidales bacterium]